MPEPPAEERINPTTSTPIHEWLYLAFVCALPIVQTFNLKLRGLTVPLADFIFPLAASAWLIAAARGKVEVRRGWFYLPLALYFVSLLCSTLASVNPQLSALKLVGKVYLLGIAALTYNLTASARFMRRAVKAWVLGTVITVAPSVLGVVLFYCGLKDRSLNFVLHFSGSLPPGNYPRLEGLFEYPAMLCNFLSVSFMLAVLMRSAGWLDSRRFWPLVTGIWVTALFTLTPGLGGIMLSAGLWLWLRFRRTSHARLSRAALAGGVAAALAFFIAAAVTLFSYSPTGADVPLARGQIKPSHRALAWQTAFETFKQYPLFGKGVGAEVSSATYTRASGGEETLTDAHNTYLSAAGETGLFGLLALSGIIFFLLKGVTPLRAEGPTHTLVKTCLALAVFDAFLYQGLVGSFEDARHLWALFGMLAASKEGLS